MTSAYHLQSIIWIEISGKVFGQLLQECLRDLGFVLLLAEASIYMRKCPMADHYEYVATYVDDFAIIMKEPQLLIDQLMTAPHYFKLKGSGPLNFHLGCGFS